MSARDRGRTFRHSQNGHDDPGEVELAQLFEGATKYVATHRPEGLGWKNTESLGPDVVGRLRKLKQEGGPDLVVQGSSELLQTVLAADLVDELRLMIFPVVLGTGKRLFGTGTAPGALRVTRSRTTASGVLIVTYARAGAVQAGSFALEQPTEAERERRAQAN